MVTILGVLTLLNERNFLEQGYFNAKLSLILFNFYILTAKRCGTLLKYSARWNLKTGWCYNRLNFSAEFYSWRGELLQQHTSHYSQEKANIVTFTLLFYEPLPILFPLRGKWDPLNKAKSVYRAGPLWPQLGLPLLTSNPCLRFFRT